MKSRHTIKSVAVIALIAGVMTVTAAEAQAPAPTPTAWDSVKVTVKRWYDYWMGEPAAPAAPVAQAVKNGAPPSAGTAAPASPAPINGATSAPAASAQATAPANNGVPAQPAAASVVPAAPQAAETREQASLRNQPLFNQQGDGSSLDDVKAVRESVKSTPVLRVKQAGVAGTSNLPKTKAGVPAYDFKRLKSVKSVPRLDIGRENEISAADFQYGKLSWTLQKPNDLKPLPRVPDLNDKEVKAAFAVHPTPVGPVRQLQAKFRVLGKPIGLDTVGNVTYKLEVGSEAKPLPYKPVPEEQLKMVAALILFEQGNQCPIIMGMFHQLARAEKTRAESEYHLGACAAQLSMHQAAFEHLSGLVASEDKEFGAAALEVLAKDLPIIYEKDFYKLVKGIKQPAKMIKEEAKDNVAYRTAKGAYRAGDYKTSSAYAAQVSEKSDYYDEARFLSSMDSWALGEKKTALKKLETLNDSLEVRHIMGSNIRAITHVNLARMYFAQKKFEKAHEHYMQVPKDHPLWVQALIEQGWTQLALEDFSGAIGNMYSLHSPYFKAVYQPQSFVVRTVGYLNICQYGDAYRTLSFLEKGYRDWYDKTNQYLANKSEPLALYNTVKTYIRGKSDDSVDGVPFQIWREMARRKDFLNLQTALNDKQDETKRYNGVNERIKAEKASIRWRAEQSKKRFDQFKAQLAKVKTDRSLAKNLDEWQTGLKRERDLTIGYRYKLFILENSRQGYLEFQKVSQAHLDKEGHSLSLSAGEALLRHANKMKEEMARVLDNNEFLRYEVFSGSGENIRYQVAGGQTGNVNRVPASIKPTKMMNWNFDGEFWEDEIGSYRSSLVNNCPTAHNAPKVPSDQASVNEN